MKLISARLYSDKRQDLLGSYCTNWLFVQCSHIDVSIHVY